MSIKLTLWAGAGKTENESELSGPQACLDDCTDEKVLIDPSMPPDRFSEIYGFPYRPKANYRLQVLETFKLIPQLEGIFRHDDEVQRERKIGKTNTKVLVTHGHHDHVGLLPELRYDLPVFMSELTMKILYRWQHDGNKLALQFIDLIDQHSEVADTSGRRRAAQGDEAVFPRDIHLFEDRTPFEAGNFIWTAHPVDHSIPTHAFIGRHKREGIKFSYTGDFRFRGRRPEDTEVYFQALRNEEVDYVLIEGSLLHFPHNGTEKDVEDKVAELLQGKAFASIAYPPRDCDRILSLYNAAKKTGRMLVVSPAQAKLLNFLDGINGYPTMEWKYIGVELPVQGKGNIRKTDCPRYLIERDYPKWQHEFLDYEPWDSHKPKKQRVSREQIRDNQDLFLRFSPYSSLAESLEVIHPRPNSIDIRSHPEAWNVDMQQVQDRRIVILQQHNMYDGPKPDYFTPSIMRSNHQVHVTGHANLEELAERLLRLSRKTKLIICHGTDPIRHFREGIAKHLDVIIPIRGEPIYLT